MAKAIDTERGLEPEGALSHGVDRDLSSLSPLPADPGAAASGPLHGVVDIGSNSVRLVIYDAGALMPVSYFNEKVFCGIGRQLAQTGQLNDAGTQRAIVAFERFRDVMKAAQVTHAQAVATAAVRDAKNGQCFVEHAEAALGMKIRVLSGEDEALVSALGVLSGIPDAHGIVCDLGGGSLELAEVHSGKVHSGVSLPIGPLRLMDGTENAIKTSRNTVDRELGRAPRHFLAKQGTLYLVGGAWRNLARIHMEHTNYPLKMLQQYRMDRATVLDLSRMIAQQSRKSLEAIGAVSKRRAETLPFAAVILERLVLITGAEDVVISAHGLREGILRELKGDDGRLIDPLLEAARTVSRRFSREPLLCEQLIPWTAPIFEDESPAAKRVREAACLLGDIAWRAHPDYRGEIAFTYVLGTQFAAIDHTDRAMLSVTLHERYPNGPVSDQVGALRRLLSPQEAKAARRLGLALRLGVTLAGATPNVLPQTSLAIEGDYLVLSMPAAHRALYGENSEKRLSSLAQTMGLTAQRRVV